MKWLIVTCDKTKWIRYAQKHLFSKYAPNEEIKYISNRSEPLDHWCFNVYEQLRNEKDEYIVFGLDDYLPIAPLVVDINRVFLEGNDRCGLGYGDSKTSEATRLPSSKFLIYHEDTKYQVTCQFSIWKRESLMRVLHEVNGTPWDFENYGRCKAVAFKEPVFRWIEEGCLSRKWPGMNVLGLKFSDIEEIWELVPQDISMCFYLGKGEYDTKFKKEYAGPKYGFNYN